WPGGAMFEVGPIELVGVCPLRLDARVAAGLLAEDRLTVGLAVARLPDLAGLATCAPPPVTLRDRSRRSPTLAVVSLEPKAARTAANASSSESWRVSTVTFILCSSGRKSGDVISCNARPEADVAALTLATRHNPAGAS